MGLFMGLRRYGDFLGFTNTSWCKKCKRVRVDGSPFAFIEVLRVFFWGKKRDQTRAPDVGMPFDTYLRSPLLVKRNPHSIVFDRSCSIIFYNGSILLLLYSVRPSDGSDCIVLHGILAPAGANRPPLRHGRVPRRIGRF
jgi:hypothetical protein